MQGRARIERPPELRIRQKTLVHSHNRRVMLMALGFFLTCFAAIRVFSFAPSVAIVLFIGGLVLFFYVAFVLLPRADARQCTRLDFMCPFCSKPLYNHSSIYTPWSKLITKGECPHCGKLLVYETSSI
jgi:hypothetical protein